MASQRFAFPPAEKPDEECLEDDCGVARKSEYCGSRGADGQGRRTRGATLEDPFIPAPGMPLRKPVDTKTAVYLACYLPYGVFVLLLIAFTIWYQSHPAVPWFITILAADVLLVGAYPQRGGKGFLERDRWDWFPLLCCALALGSGVFFGVLNSTILEPWMHMHYLRTYTDVLASAVPKIYSDAGVMHFAAGTTLDTGSAAGYLVWPYTYCAAPILDPNAAADAAVGFWAVGVNCCPSQGDFTCDDAGVGGVTSGLRVESHALGQSAGHQVGGKFDLAVNKASALYNKPVADGAVYVVWQKDPVRHATITLVIACAVFVVLLVVGACGCAAGRSLLEKVGKQMEPIHIPGMARRPKGP